MSGPWKYALGGLLAWLIISRMQSGAGSILGSMAQAMQNGAGYSPGKGYAAPDGDTEETVAPAVHGKSIPVKANGETLYWQGGSMFTTVSYPEIATAAQLITTSPAFAGATAPGGEALAQYYTPAHLMEAFPGIGPYLKGS